MSLSGALALRSLALLVIPCESVAQLTDTAVQSPSRILQEDRDRAMAASGWRSRQAGAGQQGCGPRGLTAPATLQEPHLGIKGWGHSLLQHLEFSEFTYSGSK